MVQYGCSVGLSVHSCPSGMFLPLTGISFRSDDMSNSVVNTVVVVVVVPLLGEEGDGEGVALDDDDEAPTDCCRAS